MSAKKFLIRCALVVILLTAVLVAINAYVDLYGLFRPAGERHLSIYSDERTSKYLLAHRYVPENFQGYILGPSLSANLNPKLITEYKIYNLSMMGANITEQKAVVDKALERKAPEFVIVCLHPYLTQDHGMKTGMINPKEYYGALGSMSLYKTYAIKFIREHNLMTRKYPSNQYNDYGYNFYDKILQVMPVEEKIQEQLKRPDAIKTAIDSVALQEFTTLMNTFREKNVKVIGYFHPLPFPLYDKFRAPLTAYQQTMRDVLGNDVRVVDFNTPDYEFFTKDLSNYIDHGHLSEKGQQYLLREILTQAAMVPAR
ncbi:hypothetical protein [Chryseolinea lacunae]|uniref:SGNH/GDSL hydrolase family protein n=1 Tax=Chryseolinea lacunae TaxID=2801331 RepID=A0ABS1KXV8_9BACT|nr:hypothetical protein [Chryseolinea lacunae]MBL0744234.1 hypothetical protein [Chryseolinea lacunae]